MSSSPEEFPEIPESGLLWPAILAGLICLAVGLYLVFTPAPERVDTGQTAVVTPVTPVPESTSRVGGDGRVLRFAFVDSENSSFAFAAEAFARKVSELTQGELTVETLPGGIVDGERLGELEIAQLVREGKVEMGLATTSPLTSYNPQLDILDLPFLFEDYAHADAVLDGPVGRELLSGLEENGLKGLGYLEVGFRVISSSVPLPDLEAFAGKKVRVMQSSTYMRLMDALGAEGIPSPVDKIYQMSREGYIEAADRTYPTYWDFKLYEVQRYVTETRHTYSIKAILMNLEDWRSLSPETQLALEQAARFAGVKQREMQREAAEQVKTMCRAEGITLFELSPAERQKFVEASRPLYEEYAKLRGSDLLDRIQAAGVGSQE